MREKVLGPLHPPPTSAGGGRLPEDNPKLPGEVVTREPGHGGHVVETERIGVTSIHEIPRTPKMHHLIGTHSATLARLREKPRMKATQERRQSGVEGKRGQGG